MRVLVVSMWPSEATPEFGTFVKAQVEALREQGVDVDVAPLYDTRTGAYPAARKYHRLDREATRIALARRPDVVHGHYLFPTGMIARRVAQRLGVPFVVTAHGTDVANLAEGGFAARMSLPVVRDAARVIAVSDDLAMRIEAIVPDARIEVSDMGIDSDALVPADDRDALAREIGWDPDARRTVAVGALTSNKNHLRLIEAFSAFNADRRDHGERHVLAIIGEGPQRERLERRIAELDLARDVQLVGRLPHTSLVKWMRSAHVATLLSMREGFGLVGLEALCCGTRLLASRDIPVAALVDEGTSGIRVDQANPQSIREGLEAIHAITASFDAAAYAIGRGVHDQARVVRNILEEVATGHAAPTSSA